MTFSIFFFYLFSLILISSGLVVVSTRNMVHAVMFLVLTFFNAAALFILLNAEFIAMLIIVVYVGAIAVLFLFVVMMLNIDRQEVAKETRRNLPVLIMIGIVMFCEIMLIVRFSDVKMYETKLLFPIPTDISNTHAIGNVLYTDFILPFQIAGAILFVAMIGAIVLTIRHDDHRFLRKQKISDQNARTKANSLEIAKVEFGKGLE